MVVVSHEHKFIFLKTRKTAGTSIEMLLEGKIAPSGHEVIEVRPTFVWDGGIIASRSWQKLHPEDVPLGAWREHLPSVQIKALLGDTIWNDYFRFTAVRNPFDRAVSFFFWFRQAQGLPTLTDFDTARQELHDFIEGPSHKPDRGIVFVQGEFVPQDAIRFEHMDEDLARIGKRFGLDLRSADLPRTKDNTAKFPGRHVSEYFSPQTRKTVVTKLAWAFNRYGYSKDPADVRPPRFGHNQLTQHRLNPQGEP